MVLWYFRCLRLSVPAVFEKPEVFLVFKVIVEEVLEVLVDVSGLEMIQVTCGCMILSH